MVEYISSEELQNIIKNGKYYNPATSHYDDDDSEVVCDKCNKSNLEVSIGYGEHDLCLKCVRNLTKIKKEVKINPIIIPTKRSPKISRRKGMKISNIRRRSYTKSPKKKT